MKFLLKVFIVAVLVFTTGFFALSEAATLHEDNDMKTVTNNKLLAEQSIEQILSKKMEEAELMLLAEKAEQARIDNAGGVDTGKIEEHFTKLNKLRAEDIDGEAVFHVIVQLSIETNGETFTKQFVTSNNGTIRYKAGMNDSYNNGLDLDMSLHGGANLSSISFQADSATLTNHSSPLPIPVHTNCEMVVSQMMTYNTPHFFDFGSCNITLTLHTNHQLLVR